MRPANFNSPRKSREVDNFATDILGERRVCRTPALPALRCADMGLSGAQKAGIAVAAVTVTAAAVYLVPSLRRLALIAWEGDRCGRVRCAVQAAMCGGDAQSSRCVTCDSQGGDPAPQGIEGA